MRIRLLLAGALGLLLGPAPDVAAGAPESPGEASSVSSEAGTAARRRTAGEQAAAKLDLLLEALGEHLGASAAEPLAQLLAALPPLDRTWARIGRRLGPPPRPAGCS
jgi:hypothetical protein